LVVDCRTRRPQFLVLPLRIELLLRRRRRLQAVPRST
jgi:hypothetical protein